MSRTLLKDDDGWVDIVAKFVGIGVFCLAVHQYVFKLYPVWDKEHQLVEAKREIEYANGALASKQLRIEELAGDIQAKEHRLEALNSDLAQRQSSIEALEGTLDEVRKRHERKIKELQATQESVEQELKVRLTEAQDSLRTTKSEVIAANEKMVGVYLESFAGDLIDIQMSHIRWPRERKLDLREEIRGYVAEHLTGEKDPIKQAAYSIFALFAEKDLQDGVSQYTNALMVKVFYRFDDDAQSIIAKLPDAIQQR